LCIGNIRTNQTITSGIITIESGAQVITQPGIQVSGAVVISGDTNLYAYDGTSGYASGVWRPLAICGSGEIIVCSGTQVITQNGIQVSGLVDTEVLSGQIHITSGIITVESGAQVITESGLEIVWRGVQVSGAIQVSGLVETEVLSGQIHILSGQINVESVLSGQIDTEVLSGHIHVLSGHIDTQVLSGQIHILSGEIDIIPPTTITINASGNPLSLDARSGGIPLWSGAGKSIVLKAVAANSGDIYVGGYIAGQMPFSGQGLPLAASEAVVVDIEQIGYVKAMATQSGDRIAYLAVN